MRRIPLSRRSHVTGFQPVGEQAVEHESSLERDFVTLTSFRDAGAVITAQPVTIRFEREGRPRRYTPDFHVAWSDGQADLVEIKHHPDLRADWARLRPAFAAARRWAVEHAMRFRIITERGIRGPHLVNARRLLPLRDAHLDEQAADLAITALRSMTRPRLGELVAALPFDRASGLGVVWRLIARGRLATDLAAVIGPESRLWLP